MKNTNIIKIIAAIFVLIVIATTILGIQFQTPKDGHSHTETNEDAQVVDHSTHSNALSNGNSDNPFVEEAQLYTCSMHPHFRSEDPNERCSTCEMELVPVARSNVESETASDRVLIRSPSAGLVVARNASHSEVASADLAPAFNAYQEMWQALQSDNLAEWQAAVVDFHESVAAVNWPDSLSSVVEQLNTGADHAHHVAAISAARNQFHAHSLAMIELAEAGYHQGELHVMFCPMARNGQGASWLQQDDELLNPYYGAMMLRCGDKQGVLPGSNNGSESSDGMSNQHNHVHGSH